MNFFDLLTTKFVRRSLLVVTGYLVHKGAIDADTAGQTVEAITNFAVAVGTGVTSLVLSKLSEKLK